MTAINTDLLKKVARRLTGQIGSGGVADAVVTTIPLSSATNFPTDTAVVAVIDRVDTAGTTTASLEETIIGVISGSNLVTCTRGVEGTAQAHSAGAVVEILITAKGWNDLITHLLTEHNQLGGHTNITASNITASAVQTALHYDLIAAGDLRDANDNELIKFTQTASAVNELTIANAVTASEVILSVTGGDTNINLDLTPKGSGRVRAAAVIIPTNSSTDTLTNKRNTRRIGTTTSSATPTINTDNVDIYAITAQTEAITSFTTNLSGTPTGGDLLLIEITGTAARAITWGASFEASTVALPTTTVTTAMLSVLFKWNSATSKWRCLAAV